MLVGDTVYFIKLRVVTCGKLVEKKDDDIWRIIYAENIPIEILSGFVYSSRRQAESVLASTNKNITECLTEAYNDLAWLYDPNYKGCGNVKYSVETSTNGEMNIQVNRLHIGDYRYFVHDGKVCYGKVKYVDENEMITFERSKDHLITVQIFCVFWRNEEAELYIQETNEKLTEVLSEATRMAKILGVNIENSH